jgi:hypothetical protein
MYKIHLQIYVKSRCDHIHFSRNYNLILECLKIRAFNFISQHLVVYFFLNIFKGKINVTLSWVLLIFVYPLHNLGLYLFTAFNSVRSSFSQMYQRSC